jgi:perosamine synthetase
LAPKRIRIASPSLGSSEERSVLASIRSGVLTSASFEGGPYVRRFEERLASLLGSRHVVAVSSGTSALYASLLALGLRPGDRVIVPALTFAATANVVVALGGVPVFADIELDTYCIDAGALDEAVLREAKGLVPVHLFGHVCDMDALRKLCEQHGLWMIEDAAQALLAKYRGRCAGTFGELGCFSFYPTKLITTAEGGAVATQSNELARRLRLIRNHGASRGYEVEALGLNLRLPEPLAALGGAQLRRARKLLRRRQEIARLYLEGLSGLPGIRPPQVKDYCEHSWTAFTLFVEKGRDSLLAHLEAKGIEARVYYPSPLHLLPFYRARQPSPRLPNAERAARCVLSLPLHPLMTNADVRRVISEVRAWALRQKTF